MIRDSSVASEFVKKVSVASVSACKRMYELREVKTTLMRLMYQNCLKYFENVEEMTCKAPVQLRGLKNGCLLLCGIALACGSMMFALLSG